MRARSLSRRGAPHDRDLPNAIDLRLRPTTRPSRVEAPRGRRATSAGRGRACRRHSAHRQRHARLVVDQWPMARRVRHRERKTRERICERLVREAERVVHASCQAPPRGRRRMADRDQPSLPRLDAVNHEMKVAAPAVRSALAAPSRSCRRTAPRRCSSPGIPASATASDDRLETAARPDRLAEPVQPQGRCRNQQRGDGRVAGSGNVLHTGVTRDVRILRR